MGADPAHQHDHRYPDMDDLAAQQHPTQWPQLRPPSVEVLVGVCHPDTSECPRALADFWCHLSVCRDKAYETPYRLEEVQQGPGVPSFDHGPLPVLRSARRPQQGHSASHYKSLHREVLHPQESAGLGTTAARGRLATNGRCATSATRGGTVFEVPLWSPRQDRAPDGQAYVSRD